jgi:hypothetical protein
MAMFALSEAVLLKSMRAGHMICYANALKKGV